MQGVLAFYFDFISPYAYLAWQNPRTGPRALAARHGRALALHPVLFAGLLDRWGQLGPAEIPPKRAFLVRDVMRQAAVDSIPLRYPDVHPFNPLTLLRLALSDVAGARQADVIDVLFALAWNRGAPIDDAAITGALDAIGLPGAALLARTREDAVKAALKQSTDAAVDRGVFGVPTFIVDDELIWGSDRATDVDRFLAGHDPVDRALAAAITARPLGPGRKR
jgi:2-hydroxychromene-2-carboxylate isomerase